MFPRTRMRRLRRRELQPLFKEIHLHKDCLIAPVFIDERIQDVTPIEAMPGQCRYSILKVSKYAIHLRQLGIRTMLLFGIPTLKTERADTAYASDGIIQQSISGIKKAVPDMVICTDVCACEYTTHGHCGIIGNSRDGQDIINDESLELMSKIAVSHARAGADIVAPSCMLDGVVFWIRAALDEVGFDDVLIMSYSTKFASSLYGPFREAADSAYTFGDRTTYQMDPVNGREAIRESRLDADEGADILMVKPAGWNLDVLAMVKTIGLPVAAFQVSGEYSMIKAAAERGWIDEQAAVTESFHCLKRAGADLIISYFAEDMARWLDEES